MKIIVIIFFKVNFRDSHDFFTVTVGDRSSFRQIGRVIILQKRLDGIRLDSIFFRVLLQQKDV